MSRASSAQDLIRFLLLKALVSFFPLGRPDCSPFVTKLKRETFPRIKVDNLMASSSTGDVLPYTDAIALAPQRSFFNLHHMVLSTAEEAGDLLPQYHTTMVFLCSKSLEEGWWSSLFLVLSAHVYYESQANNQRKQWKVQKSVSSVPCSTDDGSNCLVLMSCPLLKLPNTLLRCLLLRRLKREAVVNDTVYVNKRIRQQPDRTT